MKKEISKKLDGAAWEKQIEKAYEKASKNFKVDGFRPGHAPKDIFMKKYKEETLWMDAAENYIEEAYKEVMDENKDLELVAQPKVEIKSLDKNGVEFVFTLVTKPEVKLEYVGDDETDEFSIVGSKEADPFSNKISNESTIAQAILGHKVGDIVNVISPNGEYQVKVVEIF